MSPARQRFNPVGLLSLVVLSLIGVALFAAAPAGAAIEIQSFGFEVSDAGGAPSQQAGGHPDQVVTSFVFPKEPSGLPVEAPRNLAVNLPAGLVGNPTALPTCTESQLVTLTCPDDSAVGVVGLLAPASFGERQVFFPIYNMEAPPGTPAEFGFNALYITVVHLTAKVLTEQNYAVAVAVQDLPQALPYTEVTTTFWGVPADPSHDEYRGSCLGPFGPTGGICSSTAEVRPFFTNPTACSAASTASARVDSWLDTGVFASATATNEDSSGEAVAVSGCELPDFSPSIQARPTTNIADSPAGLDFTLSLPKNEDPQALAEAQLKDATVTFPAGMSVNPASAAGLGACTPAQVGLKSAVGQALARFDENPVSCPDASKLGKVEIDTPLLAQPLEGAVYLAAQNENPFNSLLALYIVVEDPRTHVLIKLAGHPTPDPQSGQLTVSFDQNPQLPFENLKVMLFPGSRASLKTPLSCGTFTTTSDLTPWTSPQGADRQPGDSFDIVSGAGNSACPHSDREAPNQPFFRAGTVDPTAGAFSPFLLKVTRADGTQPIKGIDTTLPKGLLGKLAGVSYCPDEALAAAAGKSGQAEQSSASCPAASQVGTVNVGAGAGSTPLYVNGKAYLAGPYKGAPLSLAIVTPALAGPFDLGVVVVRVALQVDPETAQIHAVSDPIPTILQGIPLDIRSIALSIDRSSFTLNPTNCEPTAINGAALSVFDQSASLSARFQAGGCGALGFKPKLALDLRGATKRSAYPALRATLTARAGDANIANAVVSLPHSEFLAQNHIKTICTRVQFAASACPKGSIYGKARAITPLLDKPLEGPVYLRSSANPLPDLVADLNGQIRVTLVGRIDSIKGGIRNSFEMVPDAPVSKFVLEMQGGKKGLLVNSRNLCKSTNKADVKMDGQNGRIDDFTPVVTNDCKSGKSKARRGKQHKKKHQKKG